MSAEGIAEKAFASRFPYFGFFFVHGVIFDPIGRYPADHIIRIFRSCKNRFQHIIPRRFFGLFIIVSFLFSLINISFGTLNLIPETVATAIAIVLLASSILIGAASLIGLKDSWRVGILEDQQTELGQARPQFKICGHIPGCCQDTDGLKSRYSQCFKKPGS